MREVAVLARLAGHVRNSSTIWNITNTKLLSKVVIFLKKKLNFLLRFSMFIPLEHVPGRVTMGMTALLTLASMFGSLSTITPPISYTTKLDVWMVSVDE